MWTTAACHGCIKAACSRCFRPWSRDGDCRSARAWRTENVDRRGIGTPLGGGSASKRDPPDGGVHGGSRGDGSRFGMFVVETVARIRRAHFVQGKSIKLICRELRVSRKVVRKVLRSAATEFHYEREQQPRPRLDAWRERLDARLMANEAKASRERLTLIRVFEALRSLGYEGGYDAV